MRKMISFAILSVAIFATNALAGTKLTVIPDSMVPSNVQKHIDKLDIGEFQPFSVSETDTDGFTVELITGEQVVFNTLVHDYKGKRQIYASEQGYELNVTKRGVHLFGSFGTSDGSFQFSRIKNRDYGIIQNMPDIISGDGVEGDGAPPPCIDEPDCDDWTQPGGSTVDEDPHATITVMFAVQQPSGIDIIPSSHNMSISQYIDEVLVTLNASFDRSDLPNVNFVKADVIYTWNKPTYYQLGREQLHYTLSNYAHMLKDDSTVNSVRNNKKADIVIGLVRSTTDPYVGWAFINSSSSTAFGVVDMTQSPTSLTFPHEVGHIMGMHHESTQSNNSSFSYGYGHYSQSLKRKTIMSYYCDGYNIISGCVRNGIFSSPKYNYGTTSTPAGGYNADNRKVVLYRAKTVAGFK